MVLKGKKLYKRRRYFVKKKLQLSFILKFFIVALLSSLIVHIVLYFLFDDRLNETLYSAHISIKSSGEIILPYLILTNLIIISIVAIISFGLVRFFVKKISGPLLKFRNTAEEIACGNLSQRVNLREGDYLFEFRDKFNLMIDGLRENITHAKDSFHKVLESEKLLSELISEISSDAEKSRNQTNLFFQNIRIFGEKVRNFKI